MYAKIFRQIYASTVAKDWKTLITFQQLLILSDADGVVDMPHEVIARITNIPEDIIRHGIKRLEKTDPRSRSPDADGRRIIRLDDHRDWGWQVTNFNYYKNLRDADTIRAQNRERQNRRRARLRTETESVTPIVTPVTHGHDTQTKTQTQTNKTTLSPNGDSSPKTQAKEILAFLNERTGKHYRDVDSNLSLIAARLKEGATPDECRAVIAQRIRKWKGDPDMEPYLRPATIFGKQNFWQKYHGELGKRQEAL